MQLLFYTIIINAYSFHQPFFSTILNYFYCCFVFKDVNSSESEDLSEALYQHYIKKLL
uniref:Uncharacterized protein n=1 Tax=Arundo donax TaxID=35708 RepID=A0A0A9FEN8_ARUDO